MENYTLLVRKYLLLFSVLLFSSITFSQTTIDTEDFNSGWGIWNDGGNRCQRLTSGTPNGTPAIELTDDRGTNSAMTTDNIDLTSYLSVDFSFEFETNSFETGEDFWVRYYDGSTWVTIATYTRGTDFNNGTTYTPTLTIDTGSYTFSSNSRFRIQADASGTGDYLYIDNITITGYTTLSCSSTVGTFPYNEGFESGTGAWIQNASDDFDWTNQTGGTTSGGTGPSGANGGSYYMYTETSSPRTTGDIAILESPCFDLTSAFSANFSFYYHMYGSTMGTLYVELSTDNGATWPNLLWSQTGEVQTSNGAAWLQVPIDLTSYVGNTVMIRFRGERGTSYNSDMAIDDISLTISTTPQPEINLVGNSTNINDGDTTPSVADDTDFGSISSGSTLDHTFTIENTGTATLNLTGGTPLVDISGDPAFTILTQPSGSSIATSSNQTFVVRFAPTGNGTVTADISIDNDDSNENPYTFRVQGTGVAPLTEGPGGVTNDLELWLKGTDGLSYTSGDPVALWADQGRGANATVNTSGQEPTYYDNPTRNVNFNPVVEFDNTYSSFSFGW